MAYFLSYKVAFLLFSFSTSNMETIDLSNKISTRGCPLAHMALKRINSWQIDTSVAVKSDSWLDLPLAEALCI